jgi:hypothetical protein
MATYGYSTPYTGRGDAGPLPPGYMEAATAPGRNLAMGIAAMGQGLGKAIEQYRTKKAETEAADQSRDTLVGLYQQQLASDPKYIAIQQYTETGQLPAGVTEQDIPRYTQQVMADREMLNKFSTVLGDKFVDMSLAKKKAALGDAVMVLNQYRTDQQQGRARELQDLQIAQARGQYETTQQLGELIRYGLTMPTTQTVTEPTTEMLQPVGPVQPATMPPTAPVFDQQGYMQALERYRQQSSVAPSDTQAIQAQLAKLQPMLVERPQQFRIPSLQGGIGGGMGVSMATITENPKQAVGRILDAQRQQQVLQAQLQRAQAPQPTMPTREQFTTQPAAQQPAAQFLPPIEVQGQTTRTEAVPYENLRRNIAQYAAQQGMRPEVFAGLDRVLEIAGQQKPIQIDTQTLPNGITVVRADGKVDILPAPKMVEGKPLTEAQGKSAAFAAGMKLNNETINSVFKSGYSPRSLTEFGFMPERLKTDSRKSYEAARDAWIENFLRDRSGAVISPDEYPAAEKQYFPIAGDSEKVVKQKELMRIDAMNNTMKKAGQNADDYVNQISSGQARSPLLSDPRVAAIRARRASGAITKEQAVKQIESLK